MKLGKARDLFGDWEEQIVDGSETGPRVRKQAALTASIGRGEGDWGLAVDPGCNRLESQGRSYEDCAGVPSGTVVNQIYRPRVEKRAKLRDLRRRQPARTVACSLEDLVAGLETSYRLWTFVERQT